MTTDTPQIMMEGRPKIAFFDYPDVFEDFYPHYGVDQKTFATTWHNTANHTWLSLIQENIADVIWYVTCIKPEITGDTHLYSGCQVRYYPSAWLHRQLWRLFYLPSFAWRWRWAYPYYGTVASYLAPLSWLLIKALRRDKPDIIYVQDYCSGRFDVLMLFAKLLKIPLVTFHSGSLSENYFGKWIKSFTIPRADWIFPSGQKEFKRLHAAYGVDHSRMNILRPPVDITIYRPISRKIACEFAGLNENNRYIIFVGRLDDSVKRISSIMRAFEIVISKYPHMHLLIVGSGNDESALRHQAALTLSQHVHFKGWVAEDEAKANLYNVADCLVLASTREASPAVIGEAFSCGIPVISSNVGGIDDLVIDDETGWLFPVGDDEELLRCLMKVAENPSKIAAMKPVVRKMAEEKVSFDAVTQALKQGFFPLL